MASKSPSLLLVKSHGAWGLPSFESACIEAAAYLRLAGIVHTDCDNVYGSSPASEDGQLPVLVDGANVVPAARVISHLKANYVDLDSKLSAEDRADALLTRTAVVGPLELSLQFFLWKYHLNTEFASQAPLPSIVQQSLAKSRQTIVHAQLHAAGLSTPVAAVRAASALYHALALKLSDAQFFFRAGAPTSLDVAVAAHVAVATQAKFHMVSNVIASLLKTSYPSLVQHSQRVLTAAHLPGYVVVPEYNVVTASKIEATLGGIRAGKLDLPADSPAVGGNVRTSSASSSSTSAASDSKPTSNSVVTLDYASAAASIALQVFRQTPSKKAKDLTPAEDEATSARRKTLQFTVASLGAMLVYLLFAKRQAHLS